MKLLERDNHGGIALSLYSNAYFLEMFSPALCADVSGLREERREKQGRDPKRRNYVRTA